MLVSWSRVSSSKEIVNDLNVKSNRNPVLTKKHEAETFPLFFLALFLQ